MSAGDPRSGDPVERIVVRVLHALEAFDKEGCEPSEAAARIREIAEEHSGLTLHLVSEAQVLTPRMHYDALLRVAGRGTISISFCGVRELPWPLRGAHHAREYELLAVNGRVLTVEEAITSSDTWLNQASITEWLVDRCLMDEAIVTERLRVSDEAINARMESFRAERGLFSGDSAESFLAAHGMTLEALERQIGGELLRLELRAHVVGDRVEPYFTELRERFDVARIARFDVEDHGAAQRLVADLRDGKVGFFEAAERSFVAGTTRNGRLFTRIRRGNLEPEQARVVFGASPGDIVGPVPSGERFDVVRVLSLEPAVLDEKTADEIAETLFAEWLRNARQAADIQWFWGRARE